MKKTNIRYGLIVGVISLSVTIISCGGNKKEKKETSLDEGNFTTATPPFHYPLC